MWCCLTSSGDLPRHLVANDGDCGGVLKDDKAGPDQQAEGRHVLEPVSLEEDPLQSLVITGVEAVAAQAVKKEKFNSGFIFVRTIFVQNGKCSPFLKLTPTL